MNQASEREEELFNGALALPAEERPQFLRQACGGDAALLRRMEALVRAHQKAGVFLERLAGPDLLGAAAVGESPPPLEEVAGTMIGRYKLLQKIGEGGCGIVYMAQQESPVQRKVALKVIRLGMDTKEVIARFEAERQALALMDHPNIARVLDAGATETGRPYFVMELVRGVKITDYCDQQNLSTAGRLQLFAQVCYAIQHAHQKGIIHRDIKPSNILVTLQDGEPVPKVIDFGIAKATQGRLTDRTLFTAFEQFIGTPAYMSPEQAQLTSEDVDTRSDIYSLGVLLYELLTGRTPFEAKELLRVGLDEMRRQIREVEPLKPSTRLRTLEAGALTTTALHRATEPPRLIHLVRGDLDWIVMRCLEKSRARRYPTTGELARDLERHLCDEPVTACPPGTLYRVQKFARRNKLAVMATAAVASALVVGLGVSTWEYAQEKAARERAVAAEEQQRQLRQQAEDAREHALAAEAQQTRLRQQAEDARERAIAAEGEQNRLRQQAEEARTNETRQRVLAEEARNNEAHQRELAEAEASKSRRGAQFIEEMLQGVGPSVVQGRDTTLLREILDRTAGRVGEDLKDQPEVEAELRQVIGKAYQALGEYDKAEAMLREALRIRRELFGNEHPDVATALYWLAAVRGDRADYAGAESMFREALAMRRRMLGDEHPDVARSLDGLGTKLTYHDALPGPGPAARGESATERTASRAGPANGPSPILDGLAGMLLMQGDEAGAERLCREALAMRRKLFGNEHPAVVEALRNLGGLLALRGNYTEAGLLCREALMTRRTLFGPEHPAVAGSLIDLAGVLSRRGDYAEAETLAREALAMQRKLLGDENPSVAASHVILAAILINRGDLAGAEAQLLDAREIEKTVPSAQLNLGRSTTELFGRLYATWAKSDPAKAAPATEWQQRLDDFNKAAKP